MKSSGKTFFRLAVLFFVLHSANLTCFSQFYTAGVDPGSVKWRQITSPHFKVIYPLTFAEHAQYIINGLEYVYDADTRSLKSSPSRLPVVIHNQTTIPSSVTPYAPKRADYFTAPPQDMYPQDWVDQLIIHEFRHTA